MSISLYNTGVSGLLASQQQLATTGNNIANVNTEGYTRQRAEQNAATGTYSGGNYVGSGTYIEDISRIYDQFSYKEQLLSQTNLSHAETLSVDLNQLDEVMTFSGGALNTSLESFYESMNSIVDNPSDLGLRSIAINQAETLSNDFNALNNNFEQMVKSSNGEIEQIASHISEVSIEIAKINEQVLHGQSASSGESNDLLDARDKLISDLSQYTSVNTVVDNLGVMTVMIGTGTTLVAGITPLAVGVQAGDPDINKTTLTVVGPNSAVHISGESIGGALGAKFEFRDENLAQVKSELNLIAMAISDTLNDAQHSGLDLSEQEGTDLFTDINTTLLQQSRVLIPTKNIGSLQASANVSDVSKIPTDEFSVEYNGIDYIMTNLSDNSTLNIGSAGAINNASTVAYGFEFIENSGTPSAGDTFIIKPTENSASLMQVTLSDGAGIAASSAIEVSPSDNNLGGGSVAVSSMNSPLAAQAYATVNNLEVDIFESSSGVFTYSVYDSEAPTPVITSGTYLAGGSGVTVDLPPSPATALFQIEINGSPSGSTNLSREKFSIADSFGVGNSSNAAVTALTQEQGIINGGKDTFIQSLGSSTADIGSKASSAELTETTAQALYTQAYNRNQSTSGVNLDEEAANLLRFQQAYQAASQIISVANTIFDTLLSVVR